MDYQLDLSAYSCPLPLMMAKKAVQKLQKGDELQLLLNGSVSVKDFELLAKEMAFSILTYTEISENCHLLLRK